MTVHFNSLHLADKQTIIIIIIIIIREYNFGRDIKSRICFNQRRTYFNYYLVLIIIFRTIFFFQLYIFTFNQVRVRESLN